MSHENACLSAHVQLHESPSLHELAHNQLANTHDNDVITDGVFPL